MALTVLDAPSNLGLKPPAPGREPGVRHLPHRLRSLGLVERLGARDAGVVPAPTYTGRIDPHTGVRQAPTVAQYARDLAQALEPLLRDRHFPLVLGGDCSILLGSALALSRLGRFGLLFLDGHLDLLTPVTSASKAAAGMDLALVTGRGPRELTHIGPRVPLVLDPDVILLGYRDPPERYGDVAVGPQRAAFQWLPLDELRRHGVAAAAHAAIKQLRTRALDGLWIHLDVDVLDDAVMPAVDSRQPGGMAYTELHEVLSVALGSGLAVGLQVTILDPDLDPDSRISRAFADALVHVLATTRHAGRPA